MLYLWPLHQQHQKPAQTSAEVGLSVSHDTYLLLLQTDWQQDALFLQGICKTRISHHMPKNHRKYVCDKL